MQHTLFIADLHLDENHPSTTDCFMRFMATHAPAAEALYILGDFFELWIGDDDNTPFNQKIKQSLKSVTEKKIPIYFIHGNRDFLVGKKFARETGCTLLPPCSLATLYGTNVLLLHGDALCSLDKQHMWLRKLTQNRLLCWLALWFPLSIRRRIGLKLRQNSKKHHPPTFNEAMGVVPTTVSMLLTRYAANYMIHGHIHIPRVFSLVANNKPAKRIVLGAWDRQGCALKWYATGQREMVFFD